MVSGKLHAPQLYSRETAPVPTEEKEGWTPGAGLGRFGKQKSLDPAGIPQQDRTARSLDNDIKNDY
jgi:hypothetical protein